MLSARSVILSALWFGWAAWSLHDALKSQESHSVVVSMPSNIFAQRTPLCGLGGAFDALVAERQARRALGEVSLPDDRLQLFKWTELEEGFVVSLGPRTDAAKLMLGGGGLVWIDKATGCATVLELYQ